ncbi:MAG: inositol monophosphatase family protein [Solirubrobacteraceae bacterium]|jgi:myo-inositol-1(or 4)-monophosphatase
MDAAATQPDWLGTCRRITAGLRAMLDAYPSPADRAVELRRGVGGDMTLVIDDAAERVIFTELERLHASGHDFTVISEERGEVIYGASPLRVIVDPIDGSLNAKRGLSPYAVSIAVADGPTMADVVFGFVYDFGLREEWTARRGGGATVNEQPLLPAGERRTDRGLLEIVAVESARPEWLVRGLPDLVGVAHRVRSYGSIAFSLCQLAAGRVDGMATLWHARSVDAAAAQLIVRESGGLVSFTTASAPLAMELNLEVRSPVVAARTPQTLAQLAAADAVRSLTA